MSALSKHSPAKRNGPNTSGWQTPFPAEPELVAEPGWECPHDVCGCGRAVKLRRNEKDKFVVYTRQVYKDPTTCQFTCFLFRPSKDNPRISTKTPVPLRFVWIGFAFGGLEPKSLCWAGQPAIAHDERTHLLSKKPASSTSRMNGPSFMPLRYTPCHCNYLSRRAGPCGCLLYTSPSPRD